VSSSDEHDSDCLVRTRGICDCDHRLRWNAAMQSAPLQEPKVSDLDAAIRRLRREVDRLTALVYVPGLWRCAKCEFQLVQANLNAGDGTVTSRNEPGDRCPNCNVPLWRVSEREAGNEMVRRWENVATERDERGRQLARLAAYAWGVDDVSEGQLAGIMQLDRVAVRRLCDEGLERLAADPISGAWGANVMERLGRTR
jgi:hypothetical protein